MKRALLCGLAGAAAVFIWSMQQPREARTTWPEHGPVAAAATRDAAAGPQPGTPLAAAPADVARSTPPQAEFDAASQADLAAPETATLDADGFSPDYGALVDEFQQQRAVEPLVDE